MSTESKYIPGPWTAVEITQLLEENERLKKVNAELLDALEDINQYLPSVFDPTDLLDLPVLLSKAKEAIQKAKSCGQE